MLVWKKEGSLENVEQVLDAREFNGETYVLVNVSPEEKGFQILGIVERMGEQSAIARKFGDDEIPESLVSVETLLRCDGCGSRRHRERVFVVRDRNASNALKVFGRECLRSAIGAMADGVLALEKASDASDEITQKFGGSWNASTEYVSAELYFALAAKVIREDGEYISRDEAEYRSREGERTVCSTNEKIGMLLTAGTYPDVVDYVTAGAARVWWLKQPLHEDTDMEFHDRVEQVVAACTEKDARIKKKFLRQAVWIVGSYLKFLERERQRDKIAEAVASLGESAEPFAVGLKIDTPAVYMGFGTFETHYTYMGELNYVHRFTLPGGQSAVWITTSTSLPEFRKGDIVTVRATVKDISPNRYKPEEMEAKLTRAKVYKRGEEPPVKTKKPKKAVSSPAA